MRTHSLSAKAAAKQHGVKKRELVSWIAERAERRTRHWARVRRGLALAGLLLSALGLMAVFVANVSSSELRQPPTLQFYPAKPELVDGGLATDLTIQVADFDSSIWERAGLDEREFSLQLRQGLVIQANGADRREEVE